MTNTPDKSEMKAVTIPGELYAFLMGEGEIDGTSFGDLNANLPGRFWWRALLRTAASSRPPADQVPDMVERVAEALFKYRAGSMDGWSPGDSYYCGMAFAALQAVPAAGRKPTEAMIEAGATAFSIKHQSTCYPSASDWECEDAAKEIYRAMQSAALKAQETGE